MVSPLDHYLRCEKSASDDLIRAIRSCSSAILREVRAIEDGSQPSPGSVRADLRELEVYLLAYDKAKAAREAVAATEAWHG